MAPGISTSHRPPRMGATHGASSRRLKEAYVDITPFISSLVTIVIAIVGGYVAMKNANNANFTELKVQIASLSTQLTDLKADVEKHNQVVERTYRVETDLHTAFKRIDELKERDEKLEQKIEKFHG